MKIWDSVYICFLKKPCFKSFTVCSDPFLENVMIISQFVEFNKCYDKKWSLIDKRYQICSILSCNVVLINMCKIWYPV